MSDYITTFSKVHFTPLKPKKEQIRIEDIAHSLSLLTRANGHFPEFYSVGQHCIHCYEEAKARGLSDRLVLACLLHDASEAYLADITRPVKKNLPKYLVIEKILQDAIYERFLGSVLTEEEKKIVSEIDDTLLYYEFYHYMGEKLQDNEPQIVSNPVFSFVPFAQIEKKYIEFSQI
nr:phosphohydrolase [Lachnospiraceae bacterium]